MTINQFSKNYENLNNIVTNEINIKDKIWIIKKGTFSNNNLTEVKENIVFETNFNSEQINNMFSDLSSLNFLALNKLKNDYKNLGYSTTGVNMHLHKLLSYPINLTIMTIFSAIIMLNIKRNKSKIFHLILGTLCSVLIYYTNFFSGLFGENEKVSEIMSIWLPLIIISLFCMIGLVRINEK